MKRILVYGDSNAKPTFDAESVPERAHWTALLAAAALSGSAEAIKVIPEGYPGRTAGDLRSGKLAPTNGRMHFPPALGSHTPIDVLLVALGTNDLVEGQPPKAVFRNLEFYKRMAEVFVRTNPGAPDLHTFYIVPPVLAAGEGFSGGSEARDELRGLMMDSNLAVIDTEEVGVRDDGVHILPADQMKLATVVFEAVKGVL